MKKLGKLDLKDVEMAPDEIKNILGGFGASGYDDPINNTCTDKGNCADGCINGCQNCKEGCSPGCDPGCKDKP